MANRRPSGRDDHAGAQQFFSKVYAYHGLKDRSGPAAAKALRCAPFAVKQYVEAARNYPMDKAGRVFGT